MSRTVVTLGSDPDLVRAFKILIGEEEFPPGTDNTILVSWARTVLQAARDRAAFEAANSDDLLNLHCLETATALDS
jgi:hypothetical protein